ncbi:hypothetical protein PQR15_20970 [Streptomyces lydicus]|nr:hypothetical protein [Streptomyces lydicus]
MGPRRSAAVSGPPVPWRGEHHPRTRAEPRAPGRPEPDSAPEADARPTPDPAPEADSGSPVPAKAKAKAAAARLIFDDPLSQQSSDDTDRGWGDRPAGGGGAADLARFLDEKPPHHL